MPILHQIVDTARLRNFRAFFLFPLFLLTVHEWDRIFVLNVVRVSAELFQECTKRLSFSTGYLPIMVLHLCPVLAALGKMCVYLVVQIDLHIAVVILSAKYSAFFDITLVFLAAGFYELFGKLGMVILKRIESFQLSAEIIEAFQCAFCHPLLIL